MKGEAGPGRPGADAGPGPVRRATRPIVLPVIPDGVARRSRRHRLDGLTVTVEAPTLTDEGWIVNGIDINVDGMGLSLPNDIPEGTLVLLSCHLDDGATFARLPAQVIHSRDEGSGVRFAVWHEAERLMLLEYLMRRELEPETTD